MLDELAVHWDKIVFLASVAVFFVLWQSRAERASERQEERDAAILSAVSDVAALIKESRHAAQEEHAGLTRLFERLDAHTVEEHRLLEKALERLITSLQHHMDDERARNTRP